MKKEHFEILLEEMNSKFNLVLEAHDALRSEIRQNRDESNAKHDHGAFLTETLNKTLNKKIDDLSNRLETVEASLSARIDSVEASLSARIDSVEVNLTSRIDAVGADLTAHRADTEAHHGMYRVKAND
jgi:chromosome segregation ATPase